MASNINQTTIRLNPSVKADFAKTCSDMGISISTAVNLFAKAVVREQRIPFEIKTDKADIITKAELGKRQHEIENGETVHFSADEWEAFKSRRDNA
ncbi:MAG: type II toxin-antitoxin system RelB/DinJ family antitoxin [Ruminococcus sp.]|jgi:DNA-damage-inducible protein J|nr:type II toxin-antitoxin system RelB/DinJ family antitoxin [Ruminococcus sp.]